MRNYIVLQENSDSVTIDNGRIFQMIKDGEHWRMPARITVPERRHDTGQRWQNIRRYCKINGIKIAIVRGFEYLNFVANDWKALARLVQSKTFKLDWSPFADYEMLTELGDRLTEITIYSQFYD